MYVHCLRRTLPGARCLNARAGQACETVKGFNLYNRSGAYSRVLLQCMRSSRNVDWDNTPSTRGDDASNLLYWLASNLKGNRSEMELLGAYLHSPSRNFAVSSWDKQYRPALPYSTVLPTQLDGATSIKASRIFEELLELPNVITSARLQQHMRLDGFFTIGPDDWICLLCLCRLVEQRLWIWWWNEKDQGRVIGQSVPEDCW